MGRFRALRAPREDDARATLTPLPRARFTAIVGASRIHGRDHTEDARTALSEHQTQALTEHEVAKQLGLSVATLRAWRLTGKGPRFVRFGRAVRYLAADVERFVEASAIDHRKHAGSSEL